MVLAGPCAMPRADLASAGRSSNFCRGPVMSFDRVLDVSAVTTLVVRMMSKVFEDVEDGTLLRVPSSCAICHLRARSAIFRGVRPTRSAGPRTHVLRRPGRFGFANCNQLGQASESALIVT